MGQSTSRRNLRASWMIERTSCMRPRAKTGMRNEPPFWIVSLIDATRRAISLPRVFSAVALRGAPGRLRDQGVEVAGRELGARKRALVLEEHVAR